MLTVVRRRLTGVTAEAAFWTTFTLPWLLLGLLASLGTIQQRFGVDVVDTTRQNLLRVVSAVLPAAAIDSFVKPFLDALLAGGRSDLTLIGFLIAFWSGSRAVLALVTGITQISGQEERRNYVRLRAHILAIYGVFLLGIAIALPLMVLGPKWVSEKLGLASVWTSVGYWSLLTLAVLVMLMFLYHWALPVRNKLVHDIPGALLAFVAWVAGSIGLRVYLAHLFKAGSVYSVAAAPIAVMLWVYVTAFAILLGAALNAVLAGEGEGLSTGRHAGSAD